MKKTISLLLAIMLLGTVTLPAFADADKYSYIDEKGKTKTEPQARVSILTEDLTELGDGWYVVDSALDYKDTRLEIGGEVKLILKNNCGITTSGGIHIKEGKKLTVYSETLNTSDNNQMGYIKVTGAPEGDAAIGSNENDSASSVVFCGGNIEVHASNFGAGIGSGFVSNSNVTIYNGSFLAYGGTFSAGIGSGNHAYCTVVINGGKIKAWSGENSEGVGKGANGIADVSVDESASVEVYTSNGEKAGKTLTRSTITVASSTFSGGSLGLICGIAGALIGALVTFFIMRKKKPAVADAEKE